MKLKISIIVWASVAIVACFVVFVAYGIATDCPNTQSYVYCAKE